MAKSRERRRIDETYRRAREFKETLRRKARQGSDITPEDFHRVDERAKDFIQYAQERMNRKGITHNL